jgi:signal peptidase II
MARTTSLFGLLLFSILSAFAVRGLLTLSDMDGQTLVNLGIMSLNLEYTVNVGINFGLAGEATNTRQLQLAGLALVVCFAIIVWGLRSDAHWSSIIAGLFAGGGLANALERILYGGVFDYLNLSFIFYNNPFSFNIADIYIFVGLVLFVFKPSEKN